MIDVLQTKVSQVERVTTGCPACSGDKMRPFGSKDGFSLVECRRCGTICMDHPPDGAECNLLYEEYYDESSFQAQPHAIRSLQNLVRSFELMRSSGRLLDIGYGQGALLNAAESLGWKCYGSDISPVSLQYGERRGWVVTPNVARDAGTSGFPAGGFDVVTMIEFLEHVANPQPFLGAAFTLLRPGGLLYLTTPNGASLNRRLLRTDWSVFNPPEHVTLWTARGMNFALDQAGFRQRQIRTEGFNPYDFLYRARKKDLPEAAGRNDAAVAINDALSKNALNRMAKNAVNACLNALRIGDSLKVRAVRDSS